MRALLQKLLDRPDLQRAQLVGAAVRGEFSQAPRELVIPPNLGYGARGYSPIIPGGSTLVFMIDAVRVTR